LLEFKNKASKGIDTVIKDTLHLDKVWKKGVKSFKSFTKSLGASFQTLAARTLDFLQQTRKGWKDQESLFEKIGNTLGDRTSEIVKLLTNPLASLSAFAALALKSGTDYEKTVLRMRKATGASVDTMRELGDVVLEVADRTDAGIARTGRIMGLLAERMELQRDAAAQMAETVLYATEITGVSDEEIGAGLVELRAKFGFTADALQKFVAGSIGVSQKSRIALGETFQNISSMSDLIQGIPGNVQREIIPQFVQLSGVLSDTFADAPMVLGKLLEGMEDVSSKSFGELQFLFGQGGANAIRAFQEGIKQGDITTAFVEMAKAIRGLPLPEYKRIATAMSDVLPFDVKTLDAIRKLDISKVEEMAGAWSAAAGDAKFLEQTAKDNRTVWQDLAAVGREILTTLEPLGAVFVDIGHGIASVLRVVVDWLKEILDVPVLGTFLKIVGVVGALTPLFVGILAVIGLMGIALGALALPFAGISLAITGLIALVALFLDFWEDIKTVVMAVVGWFERLWQGFTDSLPTLSEVGDFFSGLAHLPSGVWKGLKTGFGVFPEEEQGMAEGGVVRATPGGTRLRVAEKGKDEAIAPLDVLQGMMRDASGSDSVVQAIWGAAYHIVEGLRDQYRNAPPGNSVIQGLVASAPSLEAPVNWKTSGAYNM